jgi:membrane protein implicated in regulation of membrane protease activity
MNWWAWVVAGAVLLGAELSFVNAQFYLVFIGGAAILTGLISALAPGLGLAPGLWLQWAVFAVLAVVSMVGFRSRIYDRVSGHAQPVRSGAAINELTLPDTLAPGATCQVEHGGSFWTVRNDGATAIGAGERAHIVRREGLTLTVRSARQAN